jgi:hypothetical protein
MTLFNTAHSFSAMHVFMGVMSLTYLERSRKKIIWQQHCSVFCVVDYGKDIPSRYWTAAFVKHPH